MMRIAKTGGFHPYEDDEIKDLVKGYRVLFYKTDKKGSRIIALEK